MRINQYIASSTNYSRRSVDLLIKKGLVSVNDNLAKIGQEILDNDQIKINNRLIKPRVIRTIMLNKPVDFVCSRNGQGSKTIYELLPKKYHNLKSIGRLDKNSSGLLLLTNDGELANQLTHPSFIKFKKYIITVFPDLTTADMHKIESGVVLSDGKSALKLTKNQKSWGVTMHEGRNRQIRRTFKALGYKVNTLHRTEFGNIKLGNLKSGQYKVITKS